MTVFLTFGDAKFEQSLRRIEREAAESGFFDRLSIKRPSDLDRAFWRKHGKFVAANRRGYGCWIWKPWIILEELSGCRPGEVLVYADAGCTINGRGGSRFAEYRQMLEGTAAGVLGFQLPFEERRYTKGDAFEALDAWHLKETRHVMASIILWRRCEESIRFARDWLAFAEDYRLISGAPSVALNDPAFTAHRHDQSLFSLLSKLRGAALIDDETVFDDWRDADGIPFWTTRLKGGYTGPFRSLQRQSSIAWQRVRHLI